MKTILAQEKRVHAVNFGPDPLLLKKQGQTEIISRDVNVYKKKIRDNSYMDFAINRIALELMHFLSK